VKYLLALLFVLLPCRLEAANQLVIGMKGNHRDWTGLRGKRPPPLAQTPFLLQVYTLLIEPSFHRYLVGVVQATPGDITVTLVDDTAPGAHKVWPHALGREFQISESWFQKYPRARGPAAIRGLLAHELAHTQDNATTTDGAFGLDGIHKRTEMVTQRGAMQEGWADYQAIRFAPWQEEPYRRPTLGKDTVKEDPKVKAKYHRRTLRSFTDWMRVEAAVARVLHALATRTPAGRTRVQEAFDATNHGHVRTLPLLLRELARAHPELSYRYAAVVDRATDHAATDAELVGLFGEGGQEYVKTRTRDLAD
jgi:hypothetical protein